MQVRRRFQYQRKLIELIIIRKITRYHVFSDKIVVLKDGKIVEEGTYDQLASMEDGHFKQLITKQTVRSR